MLKKYTTEEFIVKAINKFGDKFDLSRVDYKGFGEKVEIGCKVHGFFWRTGTRFLKNGCSECNSYLARRKKALTLDEFIKRGNMLYDDYFDYSRVDYINGVTEVEIGCKVHGFFWQRPRNHLNDECKYPCSECTRERKNTETSKTFTEQIINSYDDCSKTKLFSFINEFPDDLLIAPYTPKLKDSVIITPRLDVVTPRSDIEHTFFSFTRGFPDYSDAPDIDYNWSTKKELVYYCYDNTKDKCLVPTTLYYIKVTDVDGTVYWKIGITSTRIGQRFAGIMQYIDVIWTKIYLNKYDARRVERYILNRYIDFRPFKIIRRLSKTAGHTEVFTENILPHPALIDKFARLVLV